MTDAIPPRRIPRATLDIKATRDVVVDYLTRHLIVNGGASIPEALEIEERYKVRSGTRL